MRQTLQCLHLGRADNSFHPPCKLMKTIPDLQIFFKVNQFSRHAHLSAASPLHPILLFCKLANRREQHDRLKSPVTLDQPFENVRVQLLETAVVNKKLQWLTNKKQTIH